MNLVQIKKDKKGVTLIEVLVSIGVVGYLTLTIYMALTSAVFNIGEAKQRIGAVAIANEKMEIMRNLGYEEVGVVNGIISGPMLASEEIIRNNFKYQVKIDVRYVDDIFDGSGTDDLINTDYKTVQATVEWQNRNETKIVEFVSTFVPDGVETNTGGGTLVLNTMTSGGDPVPDVNVHLESVDDDPVIDYSTSTNNEGGLVLQGVPSQIYRISLSKDGYTDVRTYPNPPESSFTPKDRDFYVDEGALNSKNFFVDLNADLILRAVNVTDNSGISGIEITLEGGTEIGSDPTTYSLNNTSVTDSDGKINHDDINPGFYEITNFSTLGNSEYDFIGINTESSFDLSPEESKEQELLFGDRGVPSLYLTVVNDETSEPISTAGVGLVNEVMVFDQGNETGEDGAVFFPIESDPVVLMEDGEYQLKVRVDGYEEYSSAVNINDLTIEEARLTPL